MKSLGIIGAGSMGSSIIRGALDAGYIRQNQLTVFDTNMQKLEELSRELPSVTYCDHALDLARQCDMIILAVKPHVLSDVLETISSALSGKALISIAAGWTVKMLSDALEGTGATFLRVMPNTPAMVGEGMTALCEEYTLSEEDFSFAQGIFEALGRTVVLPERLFDGVIALSGSSPAYVYMLIEACSPGGTTIDAVAVLEKNGFRSAVLEAMEACAEKSRKMSKG